MGTHMKEIEILDARILIIDDAEANLRLLESLLAKEGFTQVISTADSTKTIDLLTAFQPDLILLDLMMPELDGYAVLDLLAKHIPEDSYLPVIVLTADATIDTRRRALALGAKDFLTKPFDHIEAMLRIWNLIEMRLLYKKLKAYQPAIKPLKHQHSES